MNLNVISTNLCDINKSNSIFKELFWMLFVNSFCKPSFLELITEFILFGNQMKPIIQWHVICESNYPYWSNVPWSNIRIKFKLLKLWTSTTILNSIQKTVTSIGMLPTLSLCYIRNQWQSPYQLQLRWAYCNIKAPTPCLPPDTPTETPHPPWYNGFIPLSHREFFPDQYWPVVPWSISKPRDENRIFKTQNVTSAYSRYGCRMKILACTCMAITCFGKVG